ncbi:MAG: hypothetical protein KatS3mg103_0651 [Phycisphaerales bacterium]|nr:MAG: hypothetical protein KatS3mg103_0651 [Phycisphaerales bacterium]
MALAKTIIRIGVIGTLVGGGLVAVAGPERVGAALTQARQSVNEAIDRGIDGPGQDARPAAPPRSPVSPADRARPAGPGRPGRPAQRVRA